jgi:hypothetical protein
MAGYVYILINHKGGMLQVGVTAILKAVSANIARG